MYLCMHHPGSIAKLCGGHSGNSVSGTVTQGYSVPPFAAHHESEHEVGSLSLSSRALRVLSSVATVGAV